MTENDDKFWSAKRTALLLGALLCLAFHRVLFFGESFFYRDFGVLGYPTLAYFKSALLRGEFPLWNPYSNSGVPFFAQWGTMTLYPGNVIFLLLPLPWSLNLFCIAHLFLGGMGTFWLARQLVGRNWPATLGAVAFTFSGVTLATLTWPNYVVAIGWLPWVVGLSLVAAERGGRWVAWAALAGAAQLLTGAPELSALTGLTSLSLVLARVRPVRASILRWSGTQILIVALCLVQLLPFLDLLSSSQRSGGTVAEKWSLAPWGWGNLLLPMFHAFQTPQGTWYQYGQEFLSSTYLGLGTVGLVLVALKFRARCSTVLALSSLTLFGCILALGSHGFVYGWLREVIPTIAIARYPVKFLFLAPLALAILAAYALKEAKERDLATSAKWLRNTWLILAAIAAACLFQAKSFPLQYDQWQPTLNNSVLRLGAGALFFAFIWKTLQAPGRQVILWQIMTVAVLFLDGVFHLPRQNPTVANAAYRGGLWQEAHGVAPPTVQDGRVFISPEAEAIFLHSNIQKFEEDLVGKRLGAWSHLNLLEPVAKVNGSATLQLAWQKRIEEILYDRDLNSHSRENLLRMLNVKWRTSPESAVRWVPFTNSLEWVTGGQAVHAGEWAEIEAGLRAGFDPARVVYLEERPPEIPAGPAEVTIKELKVTAHELICGVATRTNSIIFIPQTWHRGWKGELDGAPAEVLRANGAFQAMLVPAGEHRVRIYYSDPMFLIGGTLSGMTLTGCLAFLFLRIGKKERGTPGQEMITQ